MLSFQSLCFTLAYKNLQWVLLTFLCKGSFYIGIKSFKYQLLSVLLNILNFEQLIKKHIYVKILKYFRSKCICASKKVSLDGCDEHTWIMGGVVLRVKEKLFDKNYRPVIVFAVVSVNSNSFLLLKESWDKLSLVELP